MNGDDPMPGPLVGLRVLELADEKGQFCGKLMADLGADLIKIEPPGGQNTRRVGPFLNDLPHPERSLSFKLSKSPAEVYRSPPMIGEHNKEIMEELLGISHEELQQGYEDGTFWPPEMPQFPYIEEARR